MPPDVRHLYVHVPFCPSICPFCNFEVRERRSGDVARYLDELERELDELASSGVVGTLGTIYFGGGTPSSLRTGELATLMSLIERYFDREPSAEITLEVHPSTVDEARAKAWVDLGVDRLSVGVQSFDDATLRRLGRPHDAATSRRAVAACLGAGARVVGLDLITAVEGQDLAAELAVAVTFSVDHISAYTLTIEDGTPFARDGVEVDDECAHQARLRCRAELEAAGFEHYEVSNFSRPGARSRHNQAYWRNRCFAGVGPGAASHLPAPPGGPVLTVRRTNPGWAAWLDGERGEPEGRDAAELFSDGILCGLRLVGGLDVDELAAMTGFDVLVERAAVIEELGAAQLLVLRTDRRGRRRLGATEAGLARLDDITARLL